MTPGWVSSSLRARTIDFGVGVPFFNQNLTKFYHFREGAKSTDIEFRDAAAGH